MRLGICQRIVSQAGRPAEAGRDVRIITAMHRILIAFALVLCLPASHASAQLVAAKDGPIVYGHHHLNVTSVDEHKKFWVNTLGGVVVTIGTNKREIIKFPNALLFMNAMA